MISRCEKYWHRNNKELNKIWRKLEISQNIIRLTIILILMAKKENKFVERLIVRKWVRQMRVYMCNVLRYAGPVLGPVLAVRALVLRRLAAFDHDMSTQRSLHLIASPATRTREALRRSDLRCYLAFNCPAIQLVLQRQRQRIDVLHSEPF